MPTERLAPTQNRLRFKLVLTLSYLSTVVQAQGFSVTDFGISEASLACLLLVATVRGLWRRQTRTLACLRHAVKLSFFPCPGPPSVSPLSFPLSSHQLRAGFSSPLLALQSPKPVVAS